MIVKVIKDTDSKTGANKNSDNKSDTKK
jgi:hypothetical protein